MKKITVLVICLIVSLITFGQENPFEKINFVIGEWSGTISDCEESTSKIESSFQFIKDGKQIEVLNDCRYKFESSAFQIEYDTVRQLIICNRMILCDHDFTEAYAIKFFFDKSRSTDTSFVFTSEQIKNLPESNENPVIEKARWTIKKISKNEYKDLLEISYPEKEFKCLRSMSLIRKQ